MNIGSSYNIQNSRRMWQIIFPYFLTFRNSYFALPSDFTLQRLQQIEYMPKLTKIITISSVVEGYMGEKYKTKNEFIAATITGIKVSVRIYRKPFCNESFSRNCKILLYPE